jgi:hypothetical protein
MSLNVIPELVEAASHDTANIGDMLAEARSAAAPLIAEIAPAGGDEVSAMIASILGTHGASFTSLATQAQGFHAEFVANLKAAANAFQNTEQEIGQTLRNEITNLEQPLVPTLEKSFGSPPAPGTIKPVPVPNGGLVNIIVGGTNEPYEPWMIINVPKIYGLTGPTGMIDYAANFFPFTPQYGTLTLNQSIATGVSALNQQIAVQMAAGNTVNVWGVSQGALVETDVIRQLMASGSPYAHNLSFTLTGDPANPNGGIVERFSYPFGPKQIPFLQIPLNGATPPNSPYTTAIYTNQYDPFADFPAHPLNLLSDANAIMGFGQHSYEFFPRPYVDQGTFDNTTYYFAPDNTLPLVNPLRSIPVIGTPIADALQPDLRVLVDMGYSPNAPWTPTPATVFDVPNVPVVAHDLVLGTQQGGQAFLHDLGAPVAMPNAYPYLGSATDNLTIDL